MSTYRHLVALSLMSFLTGCCAPDSRLQVVDKQNRPVDDATIMFKKYLYKSADDMDASTWPSGVALTADALYYKLKSRRLNANKHGIIEFCRNDAIEANVIELKSASSGTTLLLSNPLPEKVEL